MRYGKPEARATGVTGDTRTVALPQAMKAAAVRTATAFYHDEGPEPP